MDELRVRADMRKYPASPTQMGQVAAQDILFAAGDRKLENIVWDLDEKVAFSIDHEIPEHDIIHVTGFLHDVLRYIYAERWYVGSEQQIAFKNAFGEVWEKAHSHETEILGRYKEEGLGEFEGGFSKRLSMGHGYFLRKVS